MLTGARVAGAQDGPSEQPPAAPAKPPKPAPYSLPWQLRPVTVGNVVRGDTTIAFYDGGSTVFAGLLGSLKLSDEFGALVRLGGVSNAPPDPAPSGFSLVNPVLGGVYAPKLAAPLKLNVFLGLTAPVGAGGGDAPDAGQQAASMAGIWARSAMDNAMFAVNYFTVFPGIGVAYVDGRFTAQVEVTLLQLTRARGPETQDESRTNFTTGLHVGYFVLPVLSVGGELRHQRWLSTPAAVEANSAVRDTTTFAVGPRAHLQLSDSVWFRPGLALAMPLDAPMSDGEYKIVQLDLPLAF